MNSYFVFFLADKISEVYEAASKADPNNEELLSHLFMSYVRLGDFKKQQHAALALYKLVPKNPYYYWAVMSIVMQANQAEDKQAKNVILSLAERMVMSLDFPHCLLQLDTFLYLIFRFHLFRWKK